MVNRPFYLPVWPKGGEVINFPTRLSPAQWRELCVWNTNLRFRHAVQNGQWQQMFRELRAPFTG